MLSICICHEEMRPFYYLNIVNVTILHFYRISSKVIKQHY
jgi:hypothetical protein